VSHDRETALLKGGGALVVFKEALVNLQITSRALAQDVVFGTRKSRCSTKPRVMSRPSAVVAMRSVTGRSTLEDERVMTGALGCARHRGGLKCL